MYVFFGGLTTVVNWVGYWLLADLLHVPYLWATVVSQPKNTYRMSSL